MPRKPKVDNLENPIRTLRDQIKATQDELGMASPTFRRRQEDLGRMAIELMALVQDGKIRPTVAEQITMEAIPKALGTTSRGARPR